MRNWFRRHPSDRFTRTATEGHRWRCAFSAPSAAAAAAAAVVIIAIATSCTAPSHGEAAHPATTTATAATRAAEPTWYRALPNRPGARLFGRGASTVATARLTAEAEYEAHSMAVAQLKWRVRDLVERTLGRLPRGTISDDDAQAFIVGCFGPFLDALDARIVVVETQIVTTGESGVTVFALVSLDVVDVMKLIDARIRRQAQTYAVAGHGQPPPPLIGVPLDELFAVMAHEQESAWGVRSHPQPSALLVVPNWYRNLPVEPGEAVFFGVGRADGESTLMVLRLEDRARSTAFRHLRDQMRLTVELGLSDYLERAATRPMPTTQRQRIVSRVAQLASALTAAEAEVADQTTHIGPGDPPRVTAFVLARVTVAQLAAHVAAIVAVEVAELPSTEHPPEPTRAALAETMFETLKSARSRLVPSPAR